MMTDKSITAAADTKDASKIMPQMHTHNSTVKILHPEKPGKCYLSSFKKWKFRFW